MGGLGPSCAVAPQKKDIRKDQIFACICEECDMFCAKNCHIHWNQFCLTGFFMFTVNKHRDGTKFWCFTEQTYCSRSVC